MGCSLINHLAIGDFPYFRKPPNASALPKKKRHGKASFKAGRKEGFKLGDVDVSEFLDVQKRSIFLMLVQVCACLEVTNVP